jgi:hypothetical protein
MRRQSCFHTAIEAEHSDDSDGSDEGFDDRDPDVCEVRLVGCSAVCANSQRDDGREPKDDAQRDELENCVPSALSRGLAKELGCSVGRGSTLSH